MKEEVKKNYSDVTLNNLALPRYIKVKDSINDLLKVIDREKVEIDGKDRFLNALLQLIEENDGKTVDEKYDDITDAVYKGNIFSNYFEEENKRIAVEVLSQTSLLNDEEKFIYKVNFLMPDDQDFSRVYSECGKNPKKILQAYHLNENDSALVLGRIMEVSKFFRQYQAEKERAFTLKVSDIVKTAASNPTDENITKAKEAITSFPEGELKESLKQQILEIEQDVTVESPKMLDPQELKAGFASIGKGEPFVMEESPVQGKKGDDHSNMTLDDLIAQTDDDLAPTTSRLDIEIPTTDKVEMDDESTEEPESLLSKVEVPADEEMVESDVITTGEQPEDKMSNETIVSPEGEQVGQDVMTAIQKIVASAKDNANRVEKLETEISKKDEEINELNDVISEQEKHLIEKETRIVSQEQQINSYKQEMEDKDKALEKANSVVAEQESKLTNKDSQIAERDAQISSVTATLNAYKKAYDEIQHLVASAQSQVLVSDDTVQKKV